MAREHDIEAMKGDARNELQVVGQKKIIGRLMTVLSRSSALLLSTA